MIGFVYQIYIKEELVYIGYSTNLISRFITHLSLARRGTGHYNYNFYLAINGELANGRAPEIKITYVGPKQRAQIKELEDIERFNPKYNLHYSKRINSKRRYRKIEKRDYSRLVRVVKANIEFELNKHKSGVCG